ncbi:hypothetical protein HMPREF3265_04985 [Staphylococcus sp. HMSC62B09]|nr:hypothetical protein [Staphylococcus sp. HMSC62B09]MDO0969373.1 alcohol dehydrogenase [Staphylococcus haemolyticus]OHS41516.1 hypothetical protein HMPREF3265_04985 [Staphylococcus sp. HMSC62B09]
MLNSIIIIVFNVFFDNIYNNMIRAIKLIFDVKSFRSEHHIAPQIELITADDIDNAYEKVLSSKVKYRFVIDISTM